MLPSSLLNIFLRLLMNCKFLNNSFCEIHFFGIFEAHMKAKQNFRTIDFKNGQSFKRFSFSVTLFLLVLSGLLLGSCNKKIASTSSKDGDNTEKNQGVVAVSGPKVLIYKTSGNYFDKVAVILSDDKLRLIGYPDVNDIRANPKLPFPTRLIHGYLLDNRGINRNVAFLNIGYAEYSMLKKTPSADELYSMLVDNNPIAEMYDCGLESDFQDVVGELNDAIANNSFHMFKKMK